MEATCAACERFVFLRGRNAAVTRTSTPRPRTAKGVDSFVHVKYIQTSNRVEGFIKHDSKF